MFELEKEIRQWVKRLGRSRNLEEADIAELESHVRDEIARSVKDGMDEEAAFRAATGAPDEAKALEAEYGKVRLMSSLGWSYLKIALRKMRRQKGYSFINIAGLGLGMACCLLIVFYIHHELSFDRFHKDADHIYRLALDAVLGDNQINAPRSPSPMAAYLVENYPEVRSAARIVQWSDHSVRFADKEFVKSHVAFADPALFDVLTFRLVRGDPKTALGRPSTVVLTEGTAARYFGTDNPVGKFLKVDDQYDFEVTGVVEDVPQNSHLQFDLLCSLETYFSWNPRLRDLWFGNFIYYTYVRLLRPEAQNPLEAKLPGLVEEKMGSALKAVKGNLRFYLQPLTQIHLRSKLQWEYGPNGDILYVYIFAAIAVVILTIACINFMNLATARSAGRAREVGLRKVVGACRRDLIGQFIGDSTTTSLLALMAALVFVKLALPLFKSISGIELAIGRGELAWLIPVFIGLVLFTGIGAGAYPAFYLSSFEPVQVLKAGVLAGSGKVRFRRLLVVSQFVLSIAMIIGTRTIADQIRYMKTKDLGYQKDQVLAIHPGGGDHPPSPDLGKTRLKEIPGVVDAAATTFVPGQDQSSQSIDIVIPEGYTGNVNLVFRRFNADADFIRTMGMTIVKGRDISKDMPSDAKNAILLNEKAVRETGWADPIGKTVRVMVSNDQYETKTVVGVVKDFHFSPLRETIEPVYLTSDIRGLSFFVVKIRTDDIGRLVGELKKAWLNISPGNRFDYFFVDEILDAQYRSEERLNTIFSSFSLVAIAIACLGLFGLASFLAEQRRKEIGVRKVLGASVGVVVGLLCREFLKLVGLAALVGWPIAYFAMTIWLRGFAYRTSLSPWTFLGSGLAALTIAFLTVGYQAIRAASGNPVESLKYE